MRVVFLLTLAFSLQAESRFKFETAQRSEVVATLEMTSPRR
jgi:hypothetical protein